MKIINSNEKEITIKYDDNYVACTSVDYVKEEDIDRILKEIEFNKKLRRRDRWRRR